MTDRAEKCAEERIQAFLREAVKKYRYEGTTTGGDCYLWISSGELAELIRSHYPDDRELLEAAKAAANKFLKHSGSCCVQHPTTHEFSVTPESCKCDPVIKRLRTAIERRG